MENPTRRRMLAAGFAGTAVGLLGGRAASASPDTTPPTSGEGSTESGGGATESGGSTTTAAPERPTPEDLPLLQFAQGLELAARDLYQAAIDAGAEGSAVRALRDNHQAFADVLRGQLGTQSQETPDPGVLGQFESDFATSDLAALAEVGYELESAAVATHTEALRELRGVDGAHLLASILVTEARHCAVLADMSGRGDDFPAMFENDAEPLTANPSSGG